MHDDLIGYVLGLLETEEHAEIERQLEANAEIRTQVEILQWGLAAFERVRDEHNAPVGLALRTCQRVRSAAEG